LTVSRCADGVAAARPLDEAGVLVVGDRRGPLGEHHGNIVLYPVAAPQPGVIEQCLIGEVQQAALVNGADQDVKQRFFQGHEPFLS
jgi:hypothetical protein